jgi:hypothetical protein
LTDSHWKAEQQLDPRDSDQFDMTSACCRVGSVPITYTLLVIFTVDPSTGERLQDQQVIRDEAHGWLSAGGEVDRSAIPYVHY